MRNDRARRHLVAERSAHSALNEPPPIAGRLREHRKRNQSDPAGGVAAVPLKLARGTVNSEGSEMAILVIVPPWLKLPGHGRKNVDLVRR